MKKTLVYIFSVLISFGLALPVSAEQECKKHEGKQCDKKTCKRKHKHGTKMLKFVDSNKDQKVSKVEWNAHFDAMDANKDGNLTPEEVADHHKSRCQKK